MKYKLSENLITGIGDIDMQHEKLFQTIYSLNNEGLDYNKVAKIMMDLRGYVNEHFSTEEIYMKKFDYTYYQEHKLLHEKFTQDFNDLLLKLGEELTFNSMLPKLSTLLCDWLSSHYKEADVKMADFLQTKLEMISTQ